MRDVLECMKNNGGFGMEIFEEPMPDPPSNTYCNGYLTGAVAMLRALGFTEEEACHGLTSNKCFRWREGLHINFRKRLSEPSTDDYAAVDALTHRFHGPLSPFTSLVSLATMMRWMVDEEHNAEWRIGILDAAFVVAAAFDAADELDGTLDSLAPCEWSRKWRTDTYGRNEVRRSGKVWMR